MLLVRDADIGNSYMYMNSYGVQFVKTHKKRMAFSVPPARPAGASGPTRAGRHQLPLSCERCGAPTKFFHSSLHEVILVCSVREVRKPHCTSGRPAVA